MSSIQEDLSIFDKFKFERPPVGVKFLLNKPKGIEPLDKNIAFCEMLKEAQQKGAPFYSVKENFICAGPITLGMVGSDPIRESGQVGVKYGVFKEARANRRIYPVIARMERNTVSYVLFSTLDKLSFEPDVLIVTASTSQAEILLRASSYTTGKMYSSRTTPVLGCSWLYVYPYISGELNYMVTGICWGMKSLRVFPEGLILVSIPYDLLPALILNLQDMQWNPPHYTEGRDAAIKRSQQIISELIQEQQDSGLD